MNPRVKLHPRATLDLAEQATWYIRNASPAVADRFLAAAERTALMLAATPAMGKARAFRHPRLAGLRAFPLKGFDRHSIFYRPAEEGIEVVRVLHGMRDIDRILESGAGE